MEIVLISFFLVGILLFVAGYLLGKIVKKRESDVDYKNLSDEMCSTLQDVGRLITNYPVKAFADNGSVYVVKRLPRDFGDCKEGYEDISILVADIPYDSKHTDYSHRTAEELAEKINYELEIKI